MDHCDQTRNMSNVGAQSGIGPLPRWTSAYVIKPTWKAYNWMLANNDALGSYPVHYRDQTTGHWISVKDHPCVTTIWHDPPKTCPVAPHGNDRLPKCPEHADCKVPWKANIAHVPAAAYVAYMVTGDWYYLTEMSNWAKGELLGLNQSYRGFTKGYIHRLPLRAQGWGLRTLGYTAWILPDHDPLKAFFNQVVANNIDWYNQRYTDNPEANKLHIVTNGSSIVYPNDGERRTGIATWQNSFFVWSVGNLKDLGFAGAGRLLDWVAQFPVELMTSPDYCWTLASWYELRVRDTEHSPIYGSIAAVYDKNFPPLRGVACNSPPMWKYMSENRSGKHEFKKDEMSGYPWSPTGFPANFQIGLAAAADSNIANAQMAWSIFANRANQPDYSEMPQFAVIPRDPQLKHFAVDGSPVPLSGPGEGFKPCSAWPDQAQRIRQGLGFPLSRGDRDFSVDFGADRPRQGASHSLRFYFTSYVFAGKQAANELEWNHLSRSGVTPLNSLYSFSAAGLSWNSAPDFCSASSVLLAPALSPVRAWATARWYWMAGTLGASLAAFARIGRAVLGWLAAISAQP
jgi:hypothetical protein